MKCTECEKEIVGIDFFGLCFECNEYESGFCKAEDEQVSMIRGD